MFRQKRPPLIAITSESTYIWFQRRSKPHGCPLFNPAVRTYVFRRIMYARSLVSTAQSSRSRLNAHCSLLMSLHLNESLDFLQWLYTAVQGNGGCRKGISAGSCSGPRIITASQQPGMCSLRAAKVLCGSPTLPSTVVRGRECNIMSFIQFFCSD